MRAVRRRRPRGERVSTDLHRRRLGAGLRLACRGADRLGLVLEEKKEGGIYVGEIVEDGNAAKTGLVNVGDELIATSGVVFNSTTDYGGVSVKSGEETVRLPVRTERFDTVMAAIASNPSQRTVALEFQKCM